MAAGLGFKTFQTGEVLTAADTNGYLMQGILVFADAAARTSAITSPQEGQYSFLKDTNALEYYDGAAWVGAPVGDITAVTAGTGISGGGSSGAVTITNSMATEIDAKGDLVVGTGADTFARLPVGTNGYTLVADSSTATGLAYAAPASASFVGCFVYNTNDGPWNNGTTATATFPNEQFDTNGFHDNSTNNSRITIPSGYGGYYYFGALIDPDASESDLSIALRKNGSLAWSDLGTSRIWYLRNQGSNDFRVTGNVLVKAVAGDYFELRIDVASNNSTSSNVAAFWCQYLGA